MVIRLPALPWTKICFPHLWEGEPLSSPPVTKHLAPPSIRHYQLLTSLVILLRKQQRSEEMTSSQAPADLSASLGMRLASAKAMGLILLFAT